MKGLYTVLNQRAGTNSYIFKGKMSLRIYRNAINIGQENYHVQASLYQHVHIMTKNLFQ